VLALPVLLAGCQEPQPDGDAQPTAAAAAAAAATETDSDSEAAESARPAKTAVQGKVEFGNPGTIRAAGTLPKYHWQLTSAVDAKGRPIDALLVRPEHPLTLDFKDGQLAVGNTCNRMRGSYALGGYALTIDKLASTMAACADPKLTALDREVGKHLQGKLGLRLSKGDARQLELKTAAGEVLVFASVEPAATR
jgi:heat shock protein HslJ